MKTNGSAEKIKSRQEAEAIIRRWQKEGASVGFTSGVFDLIHAGHVEYLEEAAKNCDRLVVGINSDSSARELKGEKRPICTEKSRVQVIAGLTCVDLVFTFDERNNNKNVEVLRPDVYIKAGDYSSGTLTSGNLVESYGGRVQIVPFKKGFSSTGIIRQVLEAYMDELPEAGPKVHYEKAPAVFLDRDGTINEEVDYLENPKDIKMIPGAAEAMRQLSEAGYRVIIVTNQPGIGFGYYTARDFFRVNKEILTLAGKAGARVSRIYYCPHTQADNCSCRKPLKYFIERAAKELNLDISRSFVVGDRTGDIEFGRNAGVKTILVKTGAAGKDGLYEVQPDYTASDLSEASKIILRH